MQLQLSQGDSKKIQTAAARSTLIYRFWSHSVFSDALLFALYLRTLRSSCVTPFSLQQALSVRLEKCADHPVLTQ